MRNKDGRRGPDGLFVEFAFVPSLLIGINNARESFYELLAKNLSRPFNENYESPS